jgi:exodeoxyribonuclease V alpha subunit
MGSELKIHDKVMQLKNNYQKLVFNGDVGKITQIDHEEQLIVVDFDGRLAEYEFHELDEITLAYAVSIHKYQGSETPCVVMPIHTQHFKLLFRNLLYTGITRGKKKVVLLGTKKAIAIAIRNDQAKKRLTGLEDALREFFKEFILERKPQETFEPLEEDVNSGNSS